MVMIDMHLNPPDILPPVGCWLIIQMPCGRLVKVERTGHVESKDRDLEYRTSDGVVIVGRLKWAYP